MQIKGDLIQAAIAFCHAGSDAEAQVQRQIISKLIEETPQLEDIRPVTPHDTVGEVLADRMAPVDHLSDAQLAAMNALLPWGGITTDSAGRMVGGAWSAIKRSSQSPLIDPRLRAFDQRLAIRNKRVLEVGCFEGIHTIGILALGGHVTPVDSRMENILKTLVRLWAYGYTADIQVWDLEQDAPPATAPDSWDILHHVGVLYHQTNPAESLSMLLERTRDAVLLDTHVAFSVERATGSYDALGRSFPYERRGERPVSPFAGMRDHAKWLLACDLEAICEAQGFVVAKSEVRQERNGARAMIWAFRPGR